MRELQPTPTVIDLIAQRKKQKSLPERRNDPYTLALVIEGGGMGGIISGGMVVALEALGLLETFDQIHAASAGGYAAYLFKNGRTQKGLETYFHGRKHINFKNFFKRDGKVINVPGFTEEVMVNIDPGQMAKQPTPHLYSTNVLTGELTEFSGLTEATEIYNGLHLSALTPVLGGPPVEDHYDGGLRASIPWRQAFAHGATHALVLRSRPYRPHEAHPIISKIDRIGAFLLRRRGLFIPANLVYDYEKNYAKTIADMEDIAEGRFLEAIQVSGTHRRIGITNSRERDLMEGAEAGINKTLDTFKPYGLKLEHDIYIRNHLVHRRD